MEGFLEEGGLEVLLEGVESLSGRRVVQLSKAMLLLECVACVKSVMNSKIGLQVITQHRDYVNILVKGRQAHDMTSHPVYRYRGWFLGNGVSW